ncbi:RNA polymerase sigma factor SigI [Mycobacterium sp. CBMA271]|uniref:RNA polymerase sigma factor SigI n=1 Tax=unclassified Mycobacteroides TaxID=2618759 RepID=UPI0012DBD5A1|nr:MULTISPECIES: RNA polymerase sigma factor SigI [unclassified Mycobacteroides]MUM17312.1 RNA polymerase subunit sigma [Mycobacteroides sp. CBMA 326]MUM23853.1 RNA polymerase sigma factor SigI [Mycobacteroides sp. CBMA 271]
MSGSSPTHDALVSAAWRDHYPYLVNLAYQMLGDVGDAEDAAQEAFVRLARADESEIDEPRAWLSVVTGRLCLDQLRSARMRREQAGDALMVESSAPLHVSANTDPADKVTLDDEVSGALLEVLRTLSPGERVAFVLHDVFGVPFEEIASAVGRPVGTCRQLARRARTRFQQSTSRTSEVTGVEHQQLIGQFVTACANGDLTGLMAVLDPSVWGVGTIIGDPAPPPQVNRGRTDVATNLLVYLGHGATLVGGPFGQPVLLAFAQRRLFAVLTLTVHDGRVRKIEATADPAARGL